MVERAFDVHWCQRAKLCTENRAVVGKVSRASENSDDLEANVLTLPIAIQPQVEVVDPFREFKKSFKHANEDAFSATCFLVCAPNKLTGSLPVISSKSSLLNVHTGPAIVSACFSSGLN